MAPTVQSPTIGKTTAVKASAAPDFKAKHRSYILATLIFMFAALIYVGAHISTTKMEYQIAAALNVKNNLIEEQKRLKLELAMLKSPQRIENIAKNKLQMIYPDADQVISLKQTGK